MNDAFCDLMGRPRQELTGVHATKLEHGDDRAEDAVLSELLRGDREHGRCERVLQHGDGSALPVLIDANVLRDAEGVVVGGAAYVQDRRAERSAEHARQRRDELTDAFARLATELAIVGDAEGTLLYVSPTVTRLFGYDMMDLLAEVGWTFVHPDDLDQAQQIYASVVTTGVTARMLLRIRTSAGQWRWVEETCHNMLDSGIGGVVCNLVDVTERVEAEHALRRSELRYRTLAETAEEGIWACDAHGRTVYANARVADILGVTLEQVYERPAISLLDRGGAERLAVRLATRRQRGPERYELSYEHPDGQTRQLLISATPWDGDGDADGSLALVSDVTEARQAQAELAAAALKDWLTGLANRALLLDRLEQLTLHPELRPVVLFIDLDHFKIVNDSRGHAVGDELLVAVAERLRSLVGARDTVARFGGDEFVIVVEDGDEASGVRLAQDVLESLSAPVKLGSGDTLHVAACIGVAVSPDADAGDLLRYADTAMYAAKAAGRGRVRAFDPDLAEDVEQRFELAAELRVALSGDALDLHYQPIVELATGRVLGVEALARWDHPQRGSVGPDRFVPVAEMTGLSPDLDRYVLARALTQMGNLRTAGHLPSEAFVAVNISARNLRDSQLEALALQWAATSDFPPRHITLEITETAIMDEPEFAIAMLRRLRDAGFGIAIDDFGTGYSSLAYLRDLPVTTLKIDRSFVRDITTHPDALAIAASIVDLGKAVDAGVVAEGVETVAQGAMLRRLGCSSGQGWLWSRAVPADELVRAGTFSTPFDIGIRASPEPSVGRGPVPPVSPPLLAEHGLHRLLELHHGEGASLATVAAALNSEGFRTPSGARWHRTSVARAVTEAVYPKLTQGE